MSAPLRLDGTGLRDIADALRDLSSIARNHGVTIGAYGTQQVTYTDGEGRETVLELAVETDGDGDPFYVIDDRIGR